MLVLSTGGLLFVFNRNSAFLLFASIIIFSLFYIGKRIKRSIYYSSFITLIVVLALFAINFVFAINPQSLTKYSFFGVIIFTTILTLFYFNNQGNKDYFINSLYFVLKLILFHGLIFIFLHASKISFVDSIRLLYIIFLFLLVHFFNTGNPAR